MSVSLLDDEMFNDPRLKDEFPTINRIEPSEKSFYGAIGYSLLTQLSRVIPNNRNQIKVSIKNLYEAGKEQKVDPSLTDLSHSFINLVEEAADPNTNSFNFAQQLKGRMNEICAGFQIILAHIFTGSHKEKEASGILEGEPVVAENKYYFINFVKSLQIRIVLYEPDEISEASYIDDKPADRVNINIYALSKKPPTYAVIRHRLELEFDRTRNQRLLSDLPFLFKRETKFSPLSQAPQNRAPAIPIPKQFSGFNPANQSSDRVTTASSSMKNDSSMDVDPSSLTDDPEVLIKYFTSILKENFIFTTRREAKEIRKLNKAMKSENRSIYNCTSELNEFVKKYSCPENHDISEFVILKSCGKRHCRVCLKNDQRYPLVCDCRVQVKEDDLKYMLEKTVVVVCVLCDKAIEEGDGIMRGNKLVHKNC